MAKNKQRSGFDKFDRNKPPASDPVQTGDTPPEVDEDGDPVDPEATDPLPSEELPPVRPGPPAEAYAKLNEEQMRATTMREQEAIIAAHHPPCTMEDPAVHYERALISGRAIPVFTPRKDADPLLIECKDMFERLIAGGLVLPGMARDAAINLTAKLTTNLSEKSDG